MVLYNTTNLTSAVDMGDLAGYANTSSEGILFAMGLVVVFFIMLLSLKSNNDFDDALIVSSFISFVFGGILTYGKFIHIIFPLAFLIITAFTGLLMWAAKR